MSATCPACGASSPAAGACPNCGTALPPEPATVTGVSDAAATASGSGPGGDARDLPAERFGRFELLAKLGAGAFGSVYRAIDPRLARTVAVKIPNEGRLGGPEARERFVREARSAARLSHPNIVAVYEVGDEGGTPFLVSEYVEGASLADALKARRPGFGEAARLVIALADALHYAHELGVVHRDVKPANVLVDAAGTPRLTDFGLSKREALDATLTTEGQILGTPAYMSPEQARGESHRGDRRMDVYSLGAVLYQMLTGEVPFRGNARMTLLQVLYEDPRPPRRLNDQIPRDLETACLKCLEKNPDRRYPTAKALADDLRRYLNHEPLAARPPSRWDRARKFARRNRPLVLGTAGVVAALLLGIAGTTYGMVQARREAENARRAERERTAELANARAAAGKLAAQRGRWRDALDHYRAAIDLGAADEVGLRLGVLECHNALYDFRAFREELAVLAARPDLGPHRGMVRLYQGLVGFYGSEPADDPVGAFREALAAGLPPAEESYARGVTAASVPEMVDHLRAAIRTDPLHARAHDLLALALMISGRQDEAREILTRFELLSPNAVNAAVYRILDRAVSGDLPEAYRLCDAARADLGDDGHALFRAFATLMHDITREGAFWEPNSVFELRVVGELTALAPRLSRMLKEDRLAATWGAFNMFRLGIFRPVARLPVFGTASPLETIAALTRPAERKALVAAANRVMPMGIFHFAEGVALQEEGDAAGAEAAYRRAVATPSLIPAARRARFALLDALSGRAGMVPEAEQKRFEEDRRALLWRVFRDGPYPVGAGKDLVYWANESGEWELALAIAADWARRAPGDADALTALQEVEMRLGAWGRRKRTLLQLLAKTPDDPELMNRLVAVEMNQYQFARVLQLGLDGLRRTPGDPVWVGRLDGLAASLDQHLAAAAYLREKVRLWRPLHLAQLGPHGLAAGAVADPPPAATPEAVAAAAAVLSRAAAGSPLALPRAAYLARAVALLKRLDAGGHLRDPNRVAALAGDPDLAAARAADGCPVVLRDRKP